jgi:hypothetical protein
LRPSSVIPVALIFSGSIERPPFGVQGDGQPASSAFSASTEGNPFGLDACCW